MKKKKKKSGVAPGVTPWVVEATLRYQFGRTTRMANGVVRPP
jgi:hypothetical protein